MNGTKIEFLKAVILAEWVNANQHAQRVTDDFFFGHRDQFGDPESGNLATEDEIENALLALESDGFIEGYHSEFAKSRYYLNVAKALEYVNDNVQERGHSIHLIRRLGNGWVLEVLENMNQQDSGVFDEVPAADRVVSKQDNQENWGQAVEALDDAIKAIENEHSLDNELGPEKGVILRALKAGRELFEDTKMKVDIAVVMTIEPLKIAAIRYHQIAVGAFIAKAIDILSKLFGLG